MRWAGARAEAGGRDPQGTTEPTPMVHPTRRKTINDTASRVEPGTQARHVSTPAPGYQTQGETEYEPASSNKAT